MQGNPLWPVTKRFPKLASNINADITIIGAGITGISSAYYLNKAGYNTIVIEQEEIGSAATGASSGLLFYGYGTDFQDAIKLFNKDKAKLFWDESRETMKIIEDTINKNNLTAGLIKPGSIMVARNNLEQDYLEKEQTELKKIGITTNLLTNPEIRNYYTGRNFLSGLEYPECSKIHPAIFAASLADNFDIKVYEYSPFTSFEETKDYIIVKTPNATIRSKKIIFATNLNPIFGLEKHFVMESSALIASKVLDKREISKIWPNGKLIWTVSIEDDYDIIYPSDNRLILEVYSLKTAKEKLPYWYPKNFTIDKQWGDSWAKSKDWLPIIGKVRANIYVAIAMGDQGIVMGYTAGRKMPMLISGKQDEFLKLTSNKRFSK